MYLDELTFLKLGINNWGNELSSYGLNVTNLYSRTIKKDSHFKTVLHYTQVNFFFY